MIDAEINLTKPLLLKEGFNLQLRNEHRTTPAFDDDKFVARRGVNSACNVWGMRTTRNSLRFANWLSWQPREKRLGTKSDLEIFETRRDHYSNFEFSPLVMIQHSAAYWAYEYYALLAVLFNYYHAWYIQFKVSHNKFHIQHISIILSIHWWNKI